MRVVHTHLIQAQNLLLPVNPAADVHEKKRKHNDNVVMPRDKH